MATAIIGYTGFLGQHLCNYKKFDFYFNSTNINQISLRDYDVVYCAAPTGDRIRSNRDPEQDYNNLKHLISALKHVKCNNFILFGTVDSIANTSMPYGKNRAELENFIKRNFANYTILRLSSLIDSKIEKNLLYDLKHVKWVEKIVTNAVNQWYPLEHLMSDIDYALRNNIKELNLVSEPIVNEDIIRCYAADLLDRTQVKENINKYDIRPYRFSRAEIFNHINKYWYES